MKWWSNLAISLCYGNQILCFLLIDTGSMLYLSVPVGMQPSRMKIDCVVHILWIVNDYNWTPGDEQTLPKHAQHPTGRDTWSKTAQWGKALLLYRVSRYRLNESWRRCMEHSAMFHVKIKACTNVGHKKMDNIRNSDSVSIKLTHSDIQKASPSSLTIT